MNLKIELDESNKLGSRGEKFAAKSVKCIEKSALDLECSTGIVTREFYKLGYEVIGVELVHNYWDINEWEEKLRILLDEDNYKRYSKYGLENSKRFLYENKEKELLKIIAN